MKQPTVEILDKLWAKCVKERAGYKSEWSGKTENLNAHHIDGKGNYRMRWELDNGVCITNGEHFYRAHKASTAAKFRKWAMKRRGITEADIRLWKRALGGTDKFAVKIYLEQQLKKFKELNFSDK